VLLVVVVAAAILGPGPALVPPHQFTAAAATLVAPVAVGAVAGTAAVAVAVGDDRLRF